jgi:SulP family sulfate permease
MTQEPRKRLLGDLVAGISVALVLVPQSLAYAEIAGVPAYVGLSAAALPPLLAAYFASSPYLQTGPVALTSLLTFGALAPFNESRPAEYIKLAALLALIAGAIRLGLGLLRMGSVAYLMSGPVVLGFTSGAAVLILCSQLPKLFGMESDAGVLGGAFDSVTSPAEWELSAILISLFTVGVMLGGRRIHALFPSVLVAVLAVLVWSNLTDYSGFVVGELPGGFPTPSLDLPWSETSRLLVPGFIIAVVGFAEPASIARIYAAQERIPWNASRELVSQGVANLTSGVVGGFPVGGSFSRSSLGHIAGAKTRLSGAITGAVVLLLLPVAPLLENLPRAVLGAVVLAAVVKLIRVADIFRMRSVSGVQASVAAITFIVTLASSPRLEYGVIIGIGASVVAHLYRESQVEVDVKVVGSTMTIKPNGVLWFAGAHVLERKLLAAVEESDNLKSLVVDLGGVGRLDYSGADVLDTVVGDVSSRDIHVEVVNVPAHARRIVLSAGPNLTSAWKDRAEV